MSGTGKMMIIGAWIGAALLLTWLFAAQLERRENPNRQVDSVHTGAGVEVHLQRNAQGHYVASGRINGHPVRLILDTGATHVALSARLARKLALARGAPGRTRTANGIVVTYQTVLDRVELGDISIANVTASINPGMTGDDVLLGMSFLKQLEIIQRGEQLLLRHTGR